MSKKSKWLAQGVEYYPETDMLLMIRCPKCGRENWAPQVASGTCAWCGYDGHELLKDDKVNPYSINQRKVYDIRISKQ